MLRQLCTFTAGTVLLMASIAANASPITISSASIFAQTDDDSGSYGSDLDSSTAFGARSLLAVQGGHSSAIDINWEDTGSGALFDFDVNQARDGTLNGNANSTGTLRFTANVGTTFSVSGLYSADDVTSSGRVYSDVYLKNLTDGGAYLFRDYNQSLNTANESFTVGVAGEGDDDNSFIGSATGNLIAGNEYEFRFENLIQAYSGADGGASATGCVTLSIGAASGAGSCGISSVPEPMPLTMLGAGLAVLGLRRKLLAKVA